MARIVRQRNADGTFSSGGKTVIRRKKKVGRRIRKLLKRTFGVVKFIPAAILRWMPW